MSSENTGMASGKTMAMVIYALQAIGFFTVLTFIVGAIIGYVKKGDVKGTWLESHYKWQLRTFWFGILWNVIGFITIFLFIGYFILLANFIWMIYRVVKGFIRLADNAPMYDSYANVEVNVTVVKEV